jgi:hypothetical protein
MTKMAEPTEVTRLTHVEKCSDAVTSPVAPVVAPLAAAEIVHHSPIPAVGAEFVQQSQIQPSSGGLPDTAKQLHDRWQPLVAIIVGCVSVCTAIVLALASKASLEELNKDKADIQGLGYKIDALSERVGGIDKKEQENFAALSTDLKAINSELKG